MRTRSTVLALLGGAVWLYASESTNSAARPELTGRWQLNKAESEDARAKLQAAGGGEREGFGPRGGGRGGFPGGRPGLGGRSGGAPRADRPSRAGGLGSAGGPSEMREFFEPVESLTITGNDAELTLDDGLGGLTRLHLDGKAYKREGGALETRAEWKEQALLVESRSERGLKLTSSYHLLPGARKLELTSRLEGRRDPIVVRRVYDAAPADAYPSPVP